MENDDGTTALPPGLAAAWGLRERSPKGPRRGLSLDRIVAAAVEVAAAEGIGAVSMGRVAKHLGASPMALYRYVTAKDELLLLMVDAATGPPAPPPAPGGGWRPELTHWATAQRAVLLRNPWVLRVPISGPPVAPNAIAWMEQGLAALRDTALAPGDKASVILLVSSYARSEASLHTDIAEAGRKAAASQADAATDPTAAPTADPSAEALRGYADLLRALTSAGTHPHLHTVLDSGAFDTADDPDADFRFGLDRLLDGIETLVRTRERSRAESGSAPGPGSDPGSEAGSEQGPDTPPGP
ncbi:MULTISPECIES: TetR/AcrR family transcriptional regulator [Streptomyces]|uniref:TetR/AcrR family transcriptional regulator n=1 Tax=Streptomyces TaxID=1883 RepID=UPI001F52A92D|nr:MULTISPECIES: TetR/AcrR family transcriptional regulator C-terminal domain-containing protein [Streptomyces]